jgi:hypothetical protein
MPDIAQQSVERLRPSWVAAIVKGSQAAANTIALADAHEAQSILNEFVEALPNPASQAEKLVLRGVLLEIASRTGPLVHTFAHPSRYGQCGFVPGTIIERFWSVPTDSPKRAFLRWADEFFAQLARTHPHSASDCVAAVLREHYQRAWSVPALARRVYATPSQLSRQFRSEFGVSIPDYQ